MIVIYTLLMGAGRGGVVGAGTKIGLRVVGGWAGGWAGCGFILEDSVLLGM